MSEVYRVETGSFATALRGFDAERVAELIGRGFSDVTVARMAGARVPDVQKLRASLPPPVQKPNHKRVLSLWLGDILVPIPGPKWRVIAGEVAAKHDLALDDLIGPSRAAKIARARQEAYWAVYEAGRATMPQIGRWFGGRDHTTVLHGIRQHAKRIAEERA